MATEYRMTCFNNIEQKLEAEGLTFRPGKGPRKKGSLGLIELTAHTFELVHWSETDTPHVIELIDYMTGRIYYLLGDVTDAEALALQVACSYTNGDKE